MRCNLITDCENTVGLETDKVLLEAFLRARGHEVRICHWHDMSAPADVNFYLEKIAIHHLRTAEKHVGIFNLERFHARWLPYLRHMTQIWAKSASAHEWFIEQGLDQVRFTSFLARDPFNPAVPRVRRALHLAGRSSAKNTTAVLRAYWDAQAANVVLPWLTVVSFANIEPIPDRVTVYHGTVGQAFLDALLNSHRFHLCPSNVEGWGHYVVEATACGGVVITTDASPMNEHVLPTFGRLLEPIARERIGGIERCTVAPDAIIGALVELDTLPDHVLDVYGERAREWNRRRNEAFEICAGKLLEELAR